MWSENDKAIELAVQLITLTNDKKITWKRVFRETRTPSDRRYLDFAYVAEVSKDVFRLSEYRHREFYDEDRFHWASGIELEIIDREGRSLWTCPPNPAVRDLFEIVVEATTDIDGVMARLDSFAKAS